MSLISLIITLVFVGVLLWLINTYVPMPDGVKKIINITVMIILVLWILKVMGILGVHDITI